MKKTFTLLTCMLMACVIFAQPTKIVLVEEGTGTWCQWCPRGDIYGQVLGQTYPDNALFVAVHNGDPMTNDEYDAAASFQGLPSGHIDRVGISDMEPSAIQSDLSTRLGLTPPAGITVTTTYDMSTRELTMQIGAEFAESLSGDYRLAGIVVEDGITGPPPAYDQSNSYSGGGAGPMGGYEDLPQSVPANIMVYNHVGRHLAGGYNGQPGSLPADIGAGESHAHSYSYTLPEDFDPEYIYVIGLLINGTTGEILNAGRSSYLPGFDNGKPFFHSSPQENGFVGLNYQYDILTHDPEHDELTITALTSLPDGLTLTDNGEGKAVITGVPSTLGTYAITLNVNDGNWDIEQQFELTISEPQEDWVQWGAVGFSPVSADKTDIEVSATGEAFVMTSGSGQVYVHKFEDEQWIQQGSVLSGDFARASMSLSPDGIPYVFTQGAVYRLENDQWQQVGDFLPGGTYIFSDMIIAGDGTPFVSYFAPPATTNAYLFNGTSWELAGSMTDGVGVWMRFNLDNQGNPLIIYGTDGSSIAYSEVAQWDGSEWTKLGGDYIEPFSQTYFDHDVAMTPDGEIYAVLTIGTGEQHLNCYQLIDGTWQKIAENIAGGATSNCNLETDLDGNIITSFRDENLGGRTSTMRLFDGEWIHMGLPGFTGLASSQSMAVGPYGIPYVSYSDEDAGGRSSVKKYEQLTNTTTVQWEDPTLRLYPNPNNGAFVLEYSYGSTYEVVNISGQVVSRGSLTPDSKQQAFRRQQIDLGVQLESGIYFVRLIGDKGISMAKMIKN